MMMKKRTLEEVTELYFETKERIMHPEDWMGFLETACQNYKLPFDEQVLVYAQKPDATAVLTTENWNHRFSRWIDRGTKGIAVIDTKSRKNLRLKYYFDISDTHASKYARLVPVWKVLPEFRNDVVGELDRSFGPLTDKSSFLMSIWSAVNVVMDENFEHWWDMLQEVREGSKLAEVPDGILVDEYRNLLELSAVYCIGYRCGDDVRKYITPDDFSALEFFDTTDAANSLGVPTAAITQAALDAIAAQMKWLYRRWELEHWHDNERGNNNGRTGDKESGRSERVPDSVQAGERVLVAGSEVSGAETGVPSEYVGTGASGLSGEEQRVQNDEPVHEGRDAGLSDGLARPSAEHDGGDRGAPDGGRGRDGGAETPRPDGVGAQDGEHPSQSEGVRDGGDYLPIIPSPEEQLNSIEEQAEVAETSAFVISEADIERVLRSGTAFEHGKFRVVYHLTHRENEKETPKFLAKEYGIGGSTITFENGEHGWQSHDGKGWELSSSFGDDAAKVKFNWAQVGKRIAKLHEQGRYLTEKEQVEYLTWLEEEHPEEAQKLQPLPEDAKFAYKVDDVVYLNGDTYRIQWMDAERVQLSDIQYPIFSTTMTRQELESQLRQNHDNDHLLTNGDTFRIYQLKRVDETAIYAFTGLRGLEELGLSLRPDLYEQVYEAALAPEQDLEGIFQQFNLNHPSDFTGHSLSVSDVVVLVQDGQKKAYFCDSVGFREVPEFLEQTIEAQPVEPEQPTTAEKDDYDFHVGQEVILDGKLFRIESVGFHDVQLLDTGAAYPISRVESKENLAKLLKEKDNTRLNTIVVDLTGNIIEPREEQHPVSIQVDGEWQEFPSVAEAEEAALQEHRNQVRRSATNFRITDDQLGVGKPSERYENNVNAIRLLKDLEQDGEQASPEQQQILSRYVGWGGLADCFDERSSHCAELKQLLTVEEYAAARESTLTAFFTPPVVIRAIYQGLDNLGFRTGNILEPSCGVGNFIGMLPDQMSGSRFAGVELDSISGRIAKQLYPQAKIAVQGYETTNLPNEYFDAAVGNVPFGQIKVLDNEYKSQNWLIHDYFFGKTLDKVRAGGVVAFVTSKGTMDKTNPAVRKYIAQRAELLGAIRLPNNTFKSAAGTEVTSDIIFLQKREQPVEVEPDWVHLDTDANGITMNAYFASHPEMVLGEMQMVSGQFGMESACVPRDGDELSTLLTAAVQNIQGVISQRTEALEDELTPDEEMPLPDPNLRNYSYCVVDDEIYFKENGRLQPVELNATAVNRVKGMVGIRDCVRQLIQLETNEYSDEEIAAVQRKLNELYDSFSVKYGHINDRANKQAMSEDVSFPLLASLEKVDEQDKFIGKADIFTKRTIKPQMTHDSVSTPTEALEVSMATYARVDMDYMCQLTGSTEAEMYAQLRGVVYLNPEWEEGRNLDKYLTADEYLSGNVRQKLRFAKAKAEAEPEVFSGHVTALESVQPVDLLPTEINVRLGATWVPADVIEQFGYELFQTPWYFQRSIHVHFEPYTSAWRIDNKKTQSASVQVNELYGTSRINGWEILEQTLMLKDVTIYDYVEVDGKKKPILNGKETTLARSKQEQIKQAFADWIWTDPERRDRLCTLYNEQFNSIRAREYDGSFLEFAGINPEIQLRPHQVNAIARIILGGNTLLAHVVGAGKTYEIVAAAMESKRLGLCHKSMIVVPNHLVEQWATEWMQLYPAANLLVARKKDFEPKNRKKFCARIATGEYDAVIIGHSQFEKIPLSKERQSTMLEEQLDEVMDIIMEARNSRGGQFTVKQLEKERKSIQLKLQKLNDQSRKDDVLDFEELGIDRIFVDEAHYFKNLAAFTKMHNVGGISQTEAQKSSDLYMKCRYMDDLTGGRGVIFATGTPISNTMVEMYTMQRYLQNATLRQHGLSNFDAWASTFGETVTATELNPTGTGYRAKTRFAKFYNLPELMQMFREVADIQTADMLKLPVPEVERETIVLKPSEEQQQMVEALGERAERVHSGAVNSSEDNMLLITNDGRKLALDQRLVEPLLPASSTGKSAACAALVHAIWLESAEQKSTQLVFCDLSTPSDEFNVYDDLRQMLMNKGIPENEIAFIHSAKTEAQKQALFAKVNSGDVRVLIGSTFKMGAGTNVQKRLIALHHLDCPWRPSDLQQREGRIVRQGNENKTVQIYTYVTEGTFDAYLYQMVESKQKFIGQIMTSKSPVRAAEDVDEQALNYAEIKALSAGDERIKEKMDLDIDVAKLRLLKSSHMSQRFSLEDKINKELPLRIAGYEARIEGYHADIATMEQNSTPDENNFYSPMLVGGQLFDVKKEAGAALLDAIQRKHGVELTTIGKYRGFELQVRCVEGTVETFIRGKLLHQVQLSQDYVGNFMRLDHVIESLPTRLADTENKLEDTKHQLEVAKVEVTKPFPQEEELQQKQARLNQLNIELNLDKAESELTDTDTPDVAQERSVSRGGMEL